MHSKCKPGVYGVLLVFLCAGAARAAPPPVEAYSRLPAIGSAALSPDGKRVVLSVSYEYKPDQPDRELTALSVIDIDAGKVERMLAPPAKNTLRGVGWAVCYQDPVNQRLSNHWITLHEVGNVAGFLPVLVMDVWEHAFLLDYKPADRPKYIEAFFSNIDWASCEQRLQQGVISRPAAAVIRRSRRGPQPRRPRPATARAPRRRPSTRRVPPCR